jgi:glycosyltransferase involved in cell wall biosynthesis
MTDIKVSIIIPVYNVERYLKECLDSVINQTLKEIQIICVNDGSTDKSAEILEEYAQKDDRIEIYSKKNAGLGAARNTGLKYAIGEYIGFVDSDDWIDPTMYEKLYSKATELYLDMVMCPMHLFDENKNEINDNQPYFTLEYFNKEFDNKSFGYSETKDFFFDICVTAYNKIYRKEFLEKINGIFQTDMIFEDNPFFYQTYLSTNRIGLIRDFLYYYRINRPQSILDNKKGHFDDLMRMYDLSQEILISDPNFQEYENFLIYKMVNLFERFFKVDKDSKKPFFELIKHDYQNNGLMLKYIDKMDLFQRVVYNDIINSKSDLEFEENEKKNRILMKLSNQNRHNKEYMYHDYILVPPIGRTEEALDIKLYEISSVPYKKLDSSKLHINGFNGNKDNLNLLLKRIAKEKCYNSNYKEFDEVFIVPVKVRLHPRRQDILAEQPENRKANIIKYSKEITDEWHKPLFILSDFLCDIDGLAFILDGSQRLNARALRDEHEMIANLIIPPGYVFNHAKPKVSIIISVYNNEPYLTECLESLINQTLDDIEIICIDNASTDRSAKIISKFAEKDHRIKFYKMDKNIESGTLRNKGLNMARGEYICFVDADDFINNNKAIEQLYNCATENNANMVTTNIKVLKQNNTLSESIYSTKITDKKFINPKDYGIPWYHTKNIYKKKFLEKNHIIYPDYKRGQDPVFLAKVLTKVDKIFFSPIDYYVYRTIPKNALHSEEEKDYIQHFRDVLQILNIADFKEIRRKYNEMMYEFFITHKHKNSSKTLETNIKKVFGEKTPVFKIFKVVDNLNEMKKVGKLIITNRFTTFKFINNQYMGFEDNKKYFKPLILNNMGLIPIYDDGISIIVPSYNSENHIHKLLNTLQNQTIDNSLFEVIFVINGDPGKTPSIIKNFKQKHPSIDIRIFYSEITSASNARNVGIQQIKKQYVTFVDDDDYISPHFLKQLYNYSKNGRIVISEIIDVDENDPNITSNINVQLKSYQGTVDDPYKQISMMLTINACKLIPTSIIKKVKFNVDLPSGEDIVFFCNLYMLCEFEFFVLNDKQAFYYRTIRSNSVSRKKISYEFNIKERLAVIKELNKLLLFTNNLELQQFISQKIRAQVGVFMNSYLKECPEESDKVLFDIDPCFAYFPYADLNKNLAKTLIISYIFLPYVDTSAIVMAKRILKNKEFVDIIQNDVSKIRNIDRRNNVISEKYIDNQIMVNSNATFGNWEYIKDFVNEGMEKLAQLGKTGSYEKIYSRVMFPASHFLAFEYKRRYPETKWVAEFSDPILYDINSDVREGPIEDLKYLEKLNQTLENNGMKKYTGNNLFFLCEYLSYMFADEIIFTNKNQKKFMLDNFPYDVEETVNPKSTIQEQPVLPKNYYYLHESPYLIDKNFVNFAYFGSFYGKRDLFMVFNALNELNPEYRNKYRLHIFTSDVPTVIESISHLPNKNNIVVNKYVSFLEFLNLTTKFQCLIVNDALTKEKKEINPYLPSKLSDYIGSGTDVWIIYEEDSIMSKVDTKYKSRVDDPLSIRNVAQEIIKNHITSHFYEKMDYYILSD